MDQHIAQIGLAYAAFALGMLSPGPNILSVVGTSMATGRAAGVALALGVSAGSLLWATLTAVGLTALVAAYAPVLAAIKVAGGLYLLWLSFKAFRSAAAPPALQPTAGSAPAGQPLPGFFVRGLAIQMTNPKAVLTWVAIMSLGMGGAGAPAWVALAIVAGTAVLSAAGHVHYALAFSTGRVAAAYARARRGIEAALGVLFAFAGLKLLTSRA